MSESLSFSRKKVILPLKNNYRSTLTLEEYIATVVTGLEKFTLRLSPSLQSAWYSYISASHNVKAVFDLILKLILE